MPRCLARSQARSPLGCFSVEAFMLYAAIRSILQVGSSAYGKVGRMSKDESIVRRPREPFSDASLSQNADELANFMWSGAPRSKRGRMGEVYLTCARRCV